MPTLRRHAALALLGLAIGAASTNAAVPSTAGATVCETLASHESDVYVTIHNRDPAGLVLRAAADARAFGTSSNAHGGFVTTRPQGPCFAIPRARVSASGVVYLEPGGPGVERHTYSVECNVDHPRSAADPAVIDLVGNPNQPRKPAQVRNVPRARTGIEVLMPASLSDFVGWAPAPGGEHVSGKQDGGPVCVLQQYERVRLQPARAADVQEQLGMEEDEILLFRRFGAPVPGSRHVVVPATSIDELTSDGSQLWGSLSPEERVVRRPAGVEEWLIVGPGDRPLRALHHEEDGWHVLLITGDATDGAIVADFDIGVVALPEGLDVTECSDCRVVRREVALPEGLVAADGWHTVDG